MYPELTIGNFSVSTFWVAILAGTIAMGVINFLRRRRFGVRGGWSVVITLLVALGGIAGAKMLFFIESIGETSAPVSVGAGFSFYGTMFGLPLFLLLYAFIFGMRPGRFFDYVTPGIIVGFVFVRSGCFLSGCCSGIEADWGVVFPGETSPRIPTQLFEMGGALLIFAGALIAERYGAPQGALYPFFLGTYGFIRFFVEFWRDTEKIFGGLSEGQWLSIAAFAAAAVIFAVMFARKKKRSQEVRS